MRPDPDKGHTVTITFHPDNRRPDALSDGRSGRLDDMEPPEIAAGRGVSVPQQDSRLLIVALGSAIPVQRRRAVELCTSSDAGVVVRQAIPFVPVLTVRARWLENSGRSTRGCREETLVVIRADKSPNGTAGT